MATQIDPLPPPLVPCEGARVQREGITRTDIETFGSTETTPQGENVRRRKEIGSTAGELAVPQELKDMPIPPDSDPRKRRSMKAATAAASSSSSKMEISRAVADESRMDVEEEDKEESSNSKALNIRRRNDENINGGVTNG